MRRNGVLVDAVSAGEIRRALAAGFSLDGDPPPIVYTADVFDREVLELVGKHRLHVNCGSPDMIDQLGELSGRPVRQITLRLNPGFGHGHSRKTNTGGEQSKHGIWYEQLRECLEASARPRPATLQACTCTSAREPTWNICGRSAGPCSKRPSKLAKASRRSAPAAGFRFLIATVNRMSICRRIIRCGTACGRTLAESLGHPIRLEIEPGRYLVAESGYLITEIRAVKQSGKNTFYLVDAGFNNLIRPSMYGSYHPISVVPASGKLESRPEQDVVVGGPLCESGDIFTQEEGGVVCTRKLPVANGRRFHRLGGCRSVWIRDGLQLQLEAPGPGNPCFRGSPAPGACPADV